MLGSAFLEVAIGLTFVYVLLSLVCSGVNEWIAQLFSLRADTLKQGIERLIKSESLREKFYQHPLIESLSKKPAEEHPDDLTYIPARNFSLALLGAVTSIGSDGAPSSASGNTFKTLEDLVQNLPDGSDLREALLSILAAADGKIEQVQQDLEDWFNSVMARTTEWYRARAQKILLILALAFTVFFNIDTIALTTSLWQNPVLRASVAEAASNYVATTDSVSAEVSWEDLQQRMDDVRQLEELGLPIGWSLAAEDGPQALPKSFLGWIWKVIGLLFTAFAASQGAPFWFDVLKRLVNLRSSGSK